MHHPSSTTLANCKLQTANCKQLTTTQQERRNLFNMKLNFIFISFLLLILLSVSSASRLRSCRPSGSITGITPPPGECNQEHDSDCCVAGQQYQTYKCSPSVTGHTKATLTINSFEKGGDGGGPSECDSKYHPDSVPVVALSTGWYNGGSRCLNNIIIRANGRSVTAMVVDECDSIMGCDDDHDYQPPCPHNIVDASRAVWEALGISDPDDVGSLDITWSDA